MKNGIVLACLFPVALFAQDPVRDPVTVPAPASPALTYPGYHRHDGFFLSMNLGPALGGTVLKASGTDASARETIFRGPGLEVDFRIGGAIRENTILSFDIIGRTITGPEIEADGNTTTTNDDFSSVDNSYGIGLTHYFMPRNVFVSGTVSTAKMVLRDEQTDTQGESKWGFALHLKAGKEWWVGKNWGLGVSGGYGFAIAKDKTPTGADYNGTLTSHQFFLLFNTTYN